MLYWRNIKLKWRHLQNTNAVICKLINEKIIHHVGKHEYQKTEICVGITDIYLFVFFMMKDLNYESVHSKLLVE